MQTSKIAILNKINSQINGRFHSNSIAIEVLIALIMIAVFVVEIVKFYKKTYEWVN
jgi:flagellar biosynthesis protein FliR